MSLLQTQLTTRVISARSFGSLTKPQQAYMHKDDSYSVPWILGKTKSTTEIHLYRRSRLRLRMNCCRIQIWHSNVRVVGKISEAVLRSEGSSKSTHNTTRCRLLKAALWTRQKHSQPARRKLGYIQKQTFKCSAWPIFCFQTYKIY